MVLARHVAMLGLFSGPRAQTSFQVQQTGLCVLHKRLEDYEKDRNAGAYNSDIELGNAEVGQYLHKEWEELENSPQCFKLHRVPSVVLYCKDKGVISENHPGYRAATRPDRDEPRTSLRMRVTYRRPARKMHAIPIFLFSCKWRPAITKVGMIRTYKSEKALKTPCVKSMIRDGEPIRCLCAVEPQPPSPSWGNMYHSMVAVRVVYDTEMTMMPTQMNILAIWDGRKTRKYRARIDIFVNMALTL